MSKQKKLIAVILTAVMVITMLPTAAFAETSENIPEMVLMENPQDDASEIVLPEESDEETPEILLPEEDDQEASENVLPEEVSAEKPEIVLPENNADEAAQNDAPEDAESADLPDIEINLDELAELDALLKTDFTQVREAAASDPDAPGYEFDSLEDFDVDQYTAALLANNEAENWNVHLFLDMDSPAERMVTNLNNTPGFTNSIATWKGLTFDLVDAAEDAINNCGITEEQYYETVLLDMIQNAFVTPDAQEIVHLSFSTDMYNNVGIVTDLLDQAGGATIAEKIASLKGLNLSSLGVSELAEFVDTFAEVFGTAATVLDSFVKVYDNVYQFIEKYSAYQALKEFCETSLVDTLNEMSFHCTNAAMKKAVNNIKDICENELEAKLVEFSLDASLDINVLFSTVLNAAVGGVIAASPFFPYYIAQAVGKGISNMCFNTEEIKEQYYLMSVHSEFMAMLRKTVLRAEEAVKKENTKESARFFIDSLSLYFSGLENGCNYANHLATILYEAKSGHYEKKDYEEQTSYVTSIRQSYLNAHTYLLTQMWEPHFESCDQALYNEYMVMQERPGGTRILVEQISFINTAVTWRPNSGVHYLIPNVLPDNATNKSVIFSSSDSSVVEVTPDGRCTPKKYGTATITATALDGGTNTDLAPVAGYVTVTVSNDTPSFNVQNTYGDRSYTLKYTKTAEGEASVQAYSFYDRDYKTDPMPVKIPSTVVDSDGNAYTVTSVAGYGFNGKDTLVEVQLPNTVRSIGYYAFKGCTNLAKINMPEDLVSIDGYAFDGCSDLNTMDSLVLPEKLTKIGSHAFNNADLRSVILPESLVTIEDNAFRSNNFEEIEIPKNVLNIGKNAFEGCTYSVYDAETDTYNYEGLKRVFFNNYCYAPVSEHCFDGCRALEQVELGRRIASIGDYAFQNCPNLRSVYIPNTCSKIGSNAFASCESLTDIVVYTNNPYYSSDSGILFNKEKTKLICYPDAKEESSYEVPDTVETLEQYAFQGNLNLEEVILPDGLKSIGRYAFSEAKSLRSLSIPDSVTDMGIAICQECYALEYVKLSANLTQVPAGSFYYCKALAKVDIPEENNIESIEEQAFHYCAFESFPFPKDLQKIGIEAFRYSGLKEAIIPDSVFQISHRAFSFCENLEKVHLPDSLYRLFDAAFNHTAVKEFVIPEGITEIPASAFSENRSLVSVTIPSSVKTIGSSAFWDDLSLEKVVLLGNMPYIYSNAFRYLENEFTIYYPGWDDSYASASQNTDRYGAYVTPVWKMDPNNRVNVSKCSITLSKTTLTYTGKKLSVPDVTVTYNGTTVGTANYSASSVSPSGFKDPGVYTLTIKGKNGLKGSATKEIKIRPKAPKISSAANSTKGITVKWNKISNATGYVILRDDKAIKTITSNTTLQYLDTGAKTNGTVYTYKVRAYFKTKDGTKINSANSSAFKAVYMTRPSSVKLTNSAAGKMKVVWNKNSKATGYQVKYVTGSTTKTVTVKGAATVSKTLTVSKGKTYQVYVRSYKTYKSKNYYSPWSAVKTLKITK